MDKMDRLAGAVLAGGKASRFGSDKTRLPMQGRSLASHLCGLQAQAGLSPLYLCAGEAPPDLPGGVGLLPDEVEGLGPLGALATLLKASPKPVLVLGGDMPGVDAAALAALVQAWQPGSRGLVAEGQDGLHPLLAIYEPVLLDGLQRRLAQEKRSVQDWIRGEALPTWTLPSLDWVYNINTKADWERWRRGRP
jgi:molybdopterin-guanine dinucleotide biosynthesis protein A